MGDEKAERLLNLLGLLLNTRRPLVVDEIREKIYGVEASDTFHRMFERDKKELGELGYTIERTDIDTWGGEQGYLIQGDGSLLGDPGLEPDEMAALALAAAAWGGGDGTLGLMKLSSVSGIDADGGAWFPPTVEVDPNVHDLMEALIQHRAVRFSYRSSGAPEPEERIVEPHGLRHAGAWYLIGFDRGRGEVRRFKLSRVSGRVKVVAGKEGVYELPEQADLDVRFGPWEGDADERAVLAIAPEIAWQVEQRAGVTRVSERDDGWVEVSIPLPDVRRLAGWVMGFGSRAVVIGPDELRDAVRAGLRSVVEG